MATERLICITSQALLFWALDSLWHLALFTEDWALHLPFAFTFCSSGQPATHRKTWPSLWSMHGLKDRDSLPKRSKYPW
ncbi:uncharacterized protein BYT42DRAFT_341691 [Radiomyces spectabilis]|uniref:uncharacterized protein n=1 Tax=Radiomyces spectabilis TaxID=64574 RepID=UPI0022204700|nr:uncharacterized protein BYT42DRAFT_341691 [Radiomyces spectabilis]KAI8379811.1 hypothetical protein BYT42DRAFT_341691 [Radiomyces spectabilis]